MTHPICKDGRVPGQIGVKIVQISFGFNEFHFFNVYQLQWVVCKVNEP